MGKSINDLREHLFATLEGLRDKSIDVDRARAISDVAKQMIDSAKVEVEYLKATGSSESSFIDTSIGENLPPGITGIRQHRLK